MNMINTLQTIDYSNIQKDDAHLKRDTEIKLIFLNAWQHFNVYLI